MQSKNDHRISDAHQVLYSRGVPVCQTNATVTRSAANCLGIIRAVNADARFVQAHPENADQIVRPRREVVVVLGAHAIVEHPFIIAEPWPNTRAENFPYA